MTLDDFIKEQRQRLADFENHWYKMHHTPGNHPDDPNITNKEAYKLSMDPGEWDEQFHIFDDSE